MFCDYKLYIYTKHTVILCFKNKAMNKKKRVIMSMRELKDYKKKEQKKKEVGWLVGCF